MHADFTSARRYVAERLERELGEGLPYHNSWHTLEEVLPAAEQLAVLSGLGDEGLIVVRAAALFHDLGFIQRYAGHEEASADLARESLPRFGYTAQQVDEVVAAIAATRLPQTPTTPAGRVLADADLDVLGRSDFFTRNQELRHELALRGQHFSDAGWSEHQFRFLAAHSYFTEAARSLRDSGKERNLAELASRLAAPRGQSVPGLPRSN